MTFEQFRATGRFHGDLGRATDDGSAAGLPGRVYLGRLWVAGRLHEVGARCWWTVLGNRMVSGTLDAVERALYDWAVADGVA
jgi:hypothetical protein